MIDRKNITATIFVALFLVTIVGWIAYEIYEKVNVPENIQSHKSVTAEHSSEEDYNNFLDLPLEDLLNIVVVPETSELGTYDYYSNILVCNKQDSNTGIIL